MQAFNEWRQCSAAQTFIDDAVNGDSGFAAREAAHWAQRLPLCLAAQSRRAGPNDRR
ncbi:hypothetical protein [Pseudomonas nitroreducens]|uniref:hypothetical protein n=1 Tax=Pseudomonas nitroreducens TaxID=46680 RepID=UPI00209F94FF|nr:hypothetical protein [Pseudomonas nitroreducens]MCP1626008.1 hypothetical protein [Pseudomonas nitroreducens]